MTQPKVPDNVSSSELSKMLWRGLLAISLGLFFVGVLGYAAWAATPYSETELRTLESPDEAKIRAIRNEEITQLRITLGRHAPAKRRADLYLRLAEIYLESYRAEYLLEGRAYEKRLEKGQSEKSIDHA